jgi:C1A family cysteine protease
MKKTKSARLLGGVISTGSGAAAAPALAPSVDLRQFCSPIEDQGQLGSCTANAASGLVEYFERKAFGKHIDASRLFIYKATRDLLGWKGDTGAYLRSAMEALVLFGAPPEQYWPYDITKFDLEPSSFLYALGANYKTTKYYRLDPNGVTPTQVLQNIKAFLAAGFPSMFGFPVYNEYMHIPADGKVAYPSSPNHLYGGHANVAWDTMTT